MIDNTDRSEEDIEEELKEIFETEYKDVYEIKPFDNKHGLKAWVTLEDSDLGVCIGEKLKQKGYYIVNHKSESRYKDKDRQSYLVLLEAYGDSSGLI